MAKRKSKNKKAKPAARPGNGHKERQFFRRTFMVSRPLMAEIETIAHAEDRSVSHIARKAMTLGLASIFMRKSTSEPAG